MTKCHFRDGEDVEYTGRTYASVTSRASATDATLPEALEGNVCMRIFLFYYSIT
jgi:hypothetical protein